MSHRTSLVVQWLRIHPPVQKTQVRSLLQEDSTCCEELSLCAATTEPSALEPMSHNKRRHRNENPMQLERKLPPLAAARESPRAATKT